MEEGGICSCVGSLPPQENISPDDEDVLEEENLVKQQTSEGVNDPNIAVQIRGLGKTYPGSINTGCCKCKKNSPYQALKVIQASLAEVRLTEATKIRAGSYSGGMKRRLSVAIALIGDPKLVILDEPTTGMDPITRRHVWDIIENAKNGRAIVLTTHSMEEADILSDRIGIMVKGRLRCIGTLIRLKSRFGTGFIANVNFSGSNNGQTANRDVVDTTHHEAVKQFFKHHLNVLPKEENKSFLTFVIPHDRELEEVFLNIAKQAELETATAEGRLVTLTLTTSGTSIEVGKVLSVYWNQDETGTLCISGHSDEASIPPNIGPMDSLAPTPRRGIFSRPGVARGIVLDPDQIIISNSH